MQERDSLVKDNNAKKQELDGINTIITTVANSLDSISVQEHILYDGKTRDGLPLKRMQIVESINAMADMLARQRQKIQSLQDSLSQKKPSESLRKMQSVIGFLNDQLEKKNRTIASLKREVASNKKSITQLRTSLSEMTDKAARAEEKSKTLTTVVATQDEIINEGYVLIGTKKQLMAKGVLKGGFLKKKRVEYNEVDKGKFTAVDIRKFREITLKSKNPKILTPMPNNRSFYFEDTGDGTCVLVITNPTTFWSVSNFLIIQL